MSYRKQSTLQKLVDAYIWYKANDMTYHALSCLTYIRLILNEG